jgi:hypothetical protein
MVTGEGRLVLIDFGIARYYKPGRKSDTVIIGTPGFCAPEQYGGRQTDPRSDIYALGAMAWHLLTGRDPAGLAFAFPPLRQVAPGCSEALEAILARCLQFDPEGRYPSAAELLEDLRWARQTVPRQCVPAPTWRAGRGRQTQRMVRAGNQRLAAAPSVDSAGATAFAPVRSGRVPSRGPSLDRPFLLGWARRSFRVWYGTGSIHGARIFVLMFMVMVMAALAHLCLGDGPGDYFEADTCTSVLEDYRHGLSAWQRTHHGHFPGREQLELALGRNLRCPTTSVSYRYEVSPDRENYTLTCRGSHSLRHVHPQISSRSEQPRYPEEVP